MEIKTVTIVGLGALGTLFGHRLEQGMSKEDLQILADAARVARYRREGVTSNGEACDFQYVTPETAKAPVDLVLVAVKFGQLESAMETMKGQVGEATLIVSLLNGISSEDVLGNRFGRNKVVDCVAYGMDAVKEGNRLTFSNMGKLCVGTHNSGAPTEAVRRVARFFEKVGVPYRVDENMGKFMWGKFMLNVGVNQTLAAFGPNYGAIQREGEQRETMIAAMREVIALSRAEGVTLTEEEDLAYWLAVLNTLNPENKPSMRQDAEAKRRSEVGLFAGTVLALAKKHGLNAPVNQMLWNRITAMEAAY